MPLTKEERRARAKAYRRILRKLRTTVPPLLPVKVIVLAGLKHYGDTGLMFGPDDRPTYFRIRLAAGLDWPLLLDTLLHEWAHALAWAEGPYRTHHGPEWGLAMSRVYQAIVEE